MKSVTKELTLARRIRNCEVALAAAECTRMKMMWRWNIAMLKAQRDK